MIGLNEMFFEEGDQDIGTSQAVYTSSHKGKFDHHKLWPYSKT